MLQVRFSIQFLLLLGIACSCAVLKGDRSKRYRYDREPLACQEIGPNLFYDNEEVPNWGWQNYLEWIEYIFGYDSPEYLNALPDDSVWLVHDSCLHEIGSRYTKHPAYWFYPVVGITQSQAAAYTKWRTDRVFETFLTRYKVLDKRGYYQTAENYFTMERYLAGDFQGLEPDTNIKYYLKFSLPTQVQRNLALKHSDSIAKRMTGKRLSKLDKEFVERYPNFEVVEAKICDTTNYQDILPFERSYYGPFNVASIYHLKGNVSEWLSEPNTSAGGSWYHSRAQLEESDLFTDSLPNAWTGFRNVAQWVPVP